MALLLMWHRMWCRVCKVGMIPDHAYRALEPAKRARTKNHGGRGLCKSCYERAQRDDTLLDHPRSRTREELLEEVEFLMHDGVNTFEHLGARLGLTADAVSLSLRRAAQAGDERAIRIRSRLPVRKAS